MMGAVMRHPWILGLSLLALGLLGGCSYRLEAPPPPPAPPAAATPGTAPLSGGLYTAVAGDTVASVANRFNVQIRSLIEANRLAPPYVLEPGQQLAIPMQSEHIVVAGDSVWRLARAYNVDRSTLIRLNNLQPPYQLRIGERLLLPSPVENLPGGAAMATAEPSTEPGSPANSHAAITAEPLPPPSGAGVRANPPPPAPTTTAAPGQPLPLSRPPPGSATTLSPAKPPKAAPAQSAAMPTAPAASPVPEPKAMAGGKFLMPVNGKLTARFGSVSNGLHNDGINIAAPRGTPVRAAQNGVVAYAGNELKGFGNLLLIRHANGWMSAYAHNDMLLVKRGDQVKRGQVIARVGSTGNVATPQLHFELRHNTEAVDPVPNLGSS